MTFSELELIYLFGLVHDDLGHLESRCRRLESLLSRTHEREKRQELEKKLAVVLSQYRTLEPLMRRFADEIALLDIQGKNV